MITTILLGISRIVLNKDLGEFSISKFCGRYKAMKIQWNKENLVINPKKIDVAQNSTIQRKVCPE